MRPRKALPLAGGCRLEPAEDVVATTPVAVEGAAPSVPRGHTVVVAHEFLVGLHGPLRRRVRLPESFAVIFGGRFPPGVWLHRDDCPNGPSWVCLEIGDTGRLELTKGWWTFAHAQRLQTDQILLFRYNGRSTLFVTDRKSVV